MNIIRNTITFIVILFLVLVINNNNNVVESRYVSYSDPKPYKTNEKIPVFMNNIRNGLAIFDYNKYPFPKVNNDKLEYSQSFTSKLSGDLKSTSVYDGLTLNKDVPCNSVQTNITYTKDDIDTLKKLIDNNFRINFFIDDLPIGELFENNKMVDYSSSETDSKSYEETSSNDEDDEEEEIDTEKKHILLGYPIGFKYESKYYLYNHLKIFLSSTAVDSTSSISNTNEEKGYYYIQSVNVEPYSMLSCSSNTINDSIPIELNYNLKSVQYTYSIHRDYTNNGKIEQRWTIYYVNQIELSNTAIVGSFIAVTAITASLVVIFLKIFKKTNTKYTSLSPDDGGWKSIYADVFRSPNNYMTFSIIVGLGVQIASSIFILMVFSVAGLTSIATPGGMAIASILTFAFTGIFNGYSSMRTYIMLGGTRKLYNSVITITLIPFTILILIFIGYFQVWSNKYTYGASAGSVFFVLAMWLFVCVPCSLLSSYFVRTWPPAEYPVRTNPIPRYIPTPKWYQNPYLHMMLGGAIPFGIIFIELSFFLSSWVLGEHYSYSTSFCLTFILMIISIIEINMILEYYQLSLENYNWWWRSLIGPTSTGLYTFIYFIYFGISNIETNGVWFYYFMFSIIFSILVSLFCASIGFLGNLWFTKKIYSTLHFD